MTNEQKHIAIFLLERALLHSKPEQTTSGRHFGHTARYVLTFTEDERQEMSKFLDELKRGEA